VISLTGGSHPRFQGQRQAVFLNVDVATILLLAQCLEQSEQGNTRGRVLLRSAAGAHGVDVFVAGHVTYQSACMTLSADCTSARNTFVRSLLPLNVSNIFG